MKNKSELKLFDKKTISKIQKNYKANYESLLDKPKEVSAAKIQREKLEKHKIMMNYKRLLDLGGIKEEDIPSEYVEELRKVYEREIIDLKRKIEKASSRRSWLICEKCNLRIIGGNKNERKCKSLFYRF